jgi:hypothetical protein
VLEVLQVAIAGQLQLLDDPVLTATMKSLTGRRDASAMIVAQKLTAALLWEIITRSPGAGRYSRGLPAQR